MACGRMTYLIVRVNSSFLTTINIKASGCKESDMGTVSRYTRIGARTRGLLFRTNVMAVMELTSMEMVRPTRVPGKTIRNTVQEHTNLQTERSIRVIGLEAN